MELCPLTPLPRVEVMITVSGCSSPSIRTICCNPASYRGRVVPKQVSSLLSETSAPVGSKKLTWYRTCLWVQMTFSRSVGCLHVQQMFTETTIAWVDTFGVMDVFLWFDTNSVFRLYYHVWLSSVCKSRPRSKVSRVFDFRSKFLLEGSTPGSVGYIPHACWFNLR